MKKLIFLFTLSLLLVGMAWGDTYTENFDTADNWAGGSSNGYNAKTYTNSANPANDGFSTNAAVRETSETNSSGYAWRMDDLSGAYLRYECEETVNSFSIYLARWDNSPSPNFTIRYSTNSGASYTDIETLTGSWFTGDKVYKQYSHLFSTPISASAGSKVYIEVYTNSGERMLADDFVLEYGSSTPTPYLSLTPTSLSNFSYVEASGPSAEQSFDVSGTNLTDNITISIPTNYEISDDTGENFQAAINPIILTQTAGEVNQTIYVRLKAGLAIGTYNEVLTISSAGADDKTVSLSGDVLTPAAPGAPTSTTATSIGSDSFTANWNAVSGATGYYLDVYTKTIGATSTDLFISEYIEGSSYNKAIEIYNGTGTTVDLSNYSLLKQSNGAGAFGDKLSLIGKLTDGDVYVVAHSSANETILTLDDQTFDDSPMNFNGNDCVALYKNDGTNDVQIDVVGVVDQVADWGKDVTLVRKSSVSSPTTTYSTSDWDSYANDTTTYLGSHTMAGGSSSSYVTGFDNRDVSNVTSYEVTGLDPETEYYYVVRAYDAYAQTSTNSNEIEVTTAAATEDYPQGDPIPVGDDTITFTQGSANEGPAVGDLPAWNNASLDPGSVTTLSFSLIGDGPWTITIATDALYGAVYYDGDWHAFENVDGVVTIEIPSLAGKGPDVIVVLGEEDPTLPVELSSFTAVMNSDNHAVISWVTQTETGVSGYYVLRNSVEDLETALQISALIEAANTSQEHTYSFIDEYIYEPGTYYYWLHVVDIDGTEDYSDPISVVYEYQEPEVPVIPQITEFKNVYPNPFNPNTNISYALSDQQDVTFSIYNSRGQLVRQYDVGSKAAGNYSLVWDGTDYNGRTVTTGVYFIRMQAGRDSFFKKAVLMK